MKKSTILFAVNLPSNPQLLILLCSPHAGGVTDHLGLAASGIAGSTALALRDFHIHPCTGCGHCAKNGGCVYDDDTQCLFKTMNSAGALLIISPIYFYALPAPFKAFIDRSQFCWQKESDCWPVRKKAGAILVAGRPRGEKLFDGALLTLRWFLKPFCFQLTDKLLLRGLDTVADLDNQPRMVTQACVLASALAANNEIRSCSG